MLRQRQQRLQAVPILAQLRRQPLQGTRGYRALVQAPEVPYEAVLKTVLICAAKAQLWRLGEPSPLTPLRLAFI